jgi:hypothetical protein
VPDITELKADGGVAILGMIHTMYCTNILIYGFSYKNIFKLENKHKQPVLIQMSL